MTRDLTLAEEWGPRAPALGLPAGQPMKGAAVIRAAEEAMWGLWRPPPGSVHPQLRRLEGPAAGGEDVAVHPAEAGLAEARRLPWPWGDSLAEAVESLESVSQCGGPAEGPWGVAPCGQAAGGPPGR